MIPIWYSQLVNEHDIPECIGKDESFVIYKGFRITKSGGEYFLNDVRKSDFYSEVHPEDMLIFKKYGFVKGADLLMYKNDCKRNELYVNEIEKLYRKKRSLKRRKPVNERLYRNKIEKCSQAIQNMADLLFFYKLRKEEFEEQNKDLICLLKNTPVFLIMTFIGL